MMAIAGIVATRVLLLLSGMGAFFLAYFAMQAPDAFKIIVLSVYTATIFVPLVYLHLRGSNVHEP